MRALLLVLGLYSGQVTQACEFDADRAANAYAGTAAVAAATALATVSDGDLLWQQSARLLPQLDDLRALGSTAAADQVANALRRHSTVRLQTIAESPAPKSGAAYLALAIASREGLLTDNDQRCAFLARIPAPESNARVLFHRALCEARVNPTLSLERMTRAADAGHPGAALALAKLCVSQGTPAGDQCARTHLCRAASAGHPEAAAQLAYLLRTAVRPPPAQVRELYAYAYARGVANAASGLAETHELGIGGPIDLAQAVDLYAAAAELGDVGGLYNLGRLYLGGHGVPADLRRARALLQQAADAGLQPAAALLAELRPAAR